MSTALLCLPSAYQDRFAGGGAGFGGGYGGGFGDGKYQGPQSFGPPAALFAPTLSGDPNPPPTPPAETSG